MESFGWLKLHKMESFWVCKLHKMESFRVGGHEKSGRWGARFCVLLIVGLLQQG